MQHILIKELPASILNVNNYWLFVFVLIKNEIQPHKTNPDLYCNALCYCMYMYLECRTLDPTYRHALTRACHSCYRFQTNYSCPRTTCTHKSHDGVYSVNVLWYKVSETARPGYLTVHDSAGNPPPHHHHTTTTPTPHHHHTTTTLRHITTSPPPHSTTPPPHQHHHHATTTLPPHQHHHQHHHHATITPLPYHHHTTTTLRHTTTTPPHHITITPPPRHHHHHHHATTTPAPPSHHRHTTTTTTPPPHHNRAQLLSACPVCHQNFDVTAIDISFGVLP